jgi:hypothetical protein
MGLGESNASADRLGPLVAEDHSLMKVVSTKKVIFALATKVRESVSQFSTTAM